jgi:Spy/CpxP family protein refolding chaperone
MKTSKIKHGRISEVRDESKSQNRREGEKKMKRNIKTIFALAVAAAITIFVVSPAVSQDKPADNMQILLEKVKADKKLLVAANMELTESEAKGFWPVYEEYQKKLTAINQRIVRLIESYAEDYRANTLTDEKAKKLTDKLVAIGKAEAELQAASVPKLSKVLPPKKVTRYLQIESKIRAVVKYELAKGVPLVQ